MKQMYADLTDIFTKTKHNIEQFNAMLDPVIEHAKDDRERLYFHHIEEEEEQRLDRIDVLLPMLRQAIEEDMNPMQFIMLLEELNLEKFGLHNFREHIDLALFEFTDETRQNILHSMREETEVDYGKVKNYLLQLNEQFQSSTSIGIPNNQAEQPSKRPKRLTIGSLKNKI